MLFFFSCTLSQKAELGTLIYKIITIIIFFFNALRISGNKIRSYVLEMLDPRLHNFYGVYTAPYFLLRMHCCK